MATNSDREIDWEIARLSGGLSAVPRQVPSQEGFLRPCDRDLAEPPGSRRPILESLAPLAIELEEAVPDAPREQPPARRRRPTRAENAFWMGIAAVMSALAIGLVVELGTMRPQAPAAPTAAAAAAQVREVILEDDEAQAPAVVTLDPVVVVAHRPVAAQGHAAPRLARAAVAVVAPSPRADWPQGVIPPRVAAPPPAGAEMSRAGAAAAIAVAGRRAGSCTAADDARSTMPVSVTFAPSGRVTTATVDGGPFAGTSVGGCVARALRGATVGAFDGAPVTVHTNVRIR